jgi:hypothetical protein
VVAVIEILAHSFLSSASSLSADGSLMALRVAIASAIAILGPGALSVDARLFGLREIIIPAAKPLDGR